jgi:hypothetical protein
MLGARTTAAWVDLVPSSMVLVRLIEQQSASGERHLTSIPEFSKCRFPSFQDHIIKRINAE